MVETQLRKLRGASDLNYPVTSFVSSRLEIPTTSMTGIHVVPDIQQHYYIGLRQAHTTLYRIDSSMIGTHQLHLANADMIPGANISY